MIFKVFLALLVLLPASAYAELSYEVMPGNYTIEATVFDEEEAYPVSISFAIDDAGEFFSGRIDYPTYGCKAKIIETKQQGLRIVAYEEMEFGFDTCEASKYHFQINNKRMFSPSKSDYFSLLTFYEEQPLKVNVEKYSFSPSPFANMRIRLKAKRFDESLNTTDSALLRQIINRLRSKTQVGRASQALEQLVALENDRFDEIRNKSSIVAFEEYLSMFPGSAHTEEAGVTITRLKKERQILAYRKMATPESFHQAYLLSQEDVDVVSAIRSFTTIDALSGFVSDKPLLQSHQRVKGKLAVWYRQINSFEGYIQAHRLSGLKSDINDAYNVISSSSSPLQVDEQALAHYYKKTVHSINDLDEFIVVLQKITGIDKEKYYQKLMTIEGFGDDLTLNSFLHSKEYRLVLQYYTPGLKVDIDEKDVAIIMKYPEKKIILPLTPRCTYSRQVSRVVDTGWFESILSQADEKRVFFSVDDCSIESSDLKAMGAMEKKLHGHMPFTPSTWQAETYAYKEYIKRPASSHQYQAESSSTTTAHSSSSSHETKRVSQQERKPKRIRSNGKISGVPSFRVDCTDGSDHIIYHKNGSWFHGSLGHMGNKYNAWSKEDVAGFACREL